MVFIATSRFGDIFSTNIRLKLIDLYIFVQNLTNFILDYLYRLEIQTSGENLNTAPYSQEVFSMLVFAYFVYSKTR